MAHKQKAELFSRLSVFKTHHQKTNHFAQIAIIRSREPHTCLWLPSKNTTKKPIQFQQWGIGILNHHENRKSRQATHQKSNCLF
jgi:hypothetical protein